MTSYEVRQKYLTFFQNKGHKVVPSSSLVPENDPSTLFTSAGMQPMIPYLLGEPHPLGNKIVDCQKVFRTGDIEEVGVDNRHLTFLEMFGNWSFGDYWKEEQLRWFFEFLTTELGIDPQKLYVSAFEGKDQIPKDQETVEIWQKLFSEKEIEAKVGERVFFYGVEKNWWSRSGTPLEMPAGEPGGPDSEVFYLFDDIKHDPKYGEKCHPNCDCGRFVEIGNSVFMQYIKQTDGSFKELPKKNVDFGGGLERLLMAANNQPDIFRNDSHFPLIETVSSQTNVIYGQSPKNDVALRVIADHIKAAVFLIKDGVLPSNKLQGYVLRRILRRAAVKLHNLKSDSIDLLADLVGVVINIYNDTDYFQETDTQTVKIVVQFELDKFKKTLINGLKVIEKIEHISSKDAFDLYQTYGFPVEITAEIFKEKEQEIDMILFQREFEKHKELSRTTSAGMFKGGLADQTEATTKLHTANHMLQAALRQVLGEHVRQKGSHISAERLRFDFTHPEKLTEQQLKDVEQLVNQKITEDLPVHFDIEEKEQAIKNGALTNLGENYPQKVKVYKIGSEGNFFSKELCGGPHVEHTAVLGHFKILKEEGVSLGVRRIYATVSA